MQTWCQVHSTHHFSLLFWWNSKERSLMFSWRFRSCQCDCLLSNNFTCLTTQSKAFMLVWRSVWGEECRIVFSHYPYASAVDCSCSREVIKWGIMKIWEVWWEMYSNGFDPVRFFEYELLYFLCYVSELWREFLSYFITFLEKTTFL